MGALWLALVFCVTGGIIATVSLRHIQTPRHMQNLTTREVCRTGARRHPALHQPQYPALGMVRIINTLSLFGFAVIMPMMFVDELGFTTSEWLQVWAAFFFTTIFSNVFWGSWRKMGWMKVIRWFGCIGMALSSWRFTTSQHFGHNFAMALVPAIALGIFVAAFVPMAAVFRRWSRNIKGGDLGLQPVGGAVQLPGAGDCGGAAAVLQYDGVVVAYTALYVLAFFLCAYIRVEQPGLTRSSVAVALKRASSEHKKPLPTEGFVTTFRIRQ